MADSELTVPASGDRIVYAVTEGQRVNLGFTPGEVDVDMLKQDNDLVFNFDQGGSIVLQDFFLFMDNSLVVSGAELSVADFLAAFVPDLATAAGEGSTGRLGAYSDDAGNLIDGVDR
ncbi:MAG: hypothetical protein FWF99_05505, partial [Desulfovibrionaceae bacterium]|nr:hypothetical protein [Desulfovibrionaceae bacterium]